MGEDGMICTDEGVRDSGRQLLEHYLDACEQAACLNGAVLVARGAQVLVQRGVGRAGAGAERRNHADTPFRIGSLSKSFTAAAVLRQVQNGTLQLDVPVARWLPSLPHGASITVRQLLQHRSGLANHTALHDYWPTLMQQQYALDEVIGLIARQPLLFAPGSDCSYSNTGYAVLARLVEQSTGRPFVDCLQQLWQSAGLQHTRCESAAGMAPELACGYELSPDWQAATPLDISVGVGAYSLSSTVGDLFRWWCALRQGQVLDDVHRRLMFDAAGRQGFALGWYRDDELLAGRMQPVIEHFGDVNGYSAMFMHWPEEGLTVIVLSNVVQTPVYGVALRLARLACGETIAMPQSLLPLSVASGWESGRYGDAQGCSLEMDAARGELTMVRRYGERCRLALRPTWVAADHSRWQALQVDEVFHFYRQADGGQGMRHYTPDGHCHEASLQLQAVVPL